MSFFRPAAEAWAVAWLIGAYTLIFGTMMLALAFRLRGLRREGEDFAAGAGTGHGLTR